jgi:Flp pilus assembly protein TadG
MSRQASLSKSAVWKAVRKFMTGESGAALVEFTVFAPMLVAIAVYTMDFGLLHYAKMEVQNAAQAGAEYAIVNNGYDPLNIAPILSAVTGATKFTAVTPAVSQFCGCPTATALTKCSDSCDTCTTCVSTKGHYVTVTATPTTSYTPLIRFGVMASSYDISAKSTVRIR